MTTVSLLAELRERQVELWLEQDRLRYRAPEGGLTPELRSRVQEHRAEIIELLLRSQEAGRSAHSGILAAPEGDLPLSFAQSRLWFLHYLDPFNPSYNMPAALHLEGEIGVPALEAALSLVVRRHEPLQTTFLLSGGQPLQVVGAPAPVRIPVIDLSGLPPAVREEEVRRRTFEEARRPFDLEQGPLLRTPLLRLGRAEHRLLVVTHHIAADGLSIHIFLEELAQGYAASSRGEEPRLPELPVRYADYVWWQRERFQGEALAREMGFWRKWLAGAPASLELPVDRPRPAALSWRGGMAVTPLPRELADALAALRQQAGATSFMLFLAAWSSLLARYTGQTDLLVGAPVAGRLHKSFRRLIGFFVNTLVFRLEASGDPTFRELLRRVREVVLVTQTHQEMPFEKLVEELALGRSLNQTPLFQVLLTVQPPLPAFHLPDLRPAVVELETGTSKFDLTLLLTESEDGLTAALEYNADLFDQATAFRMLEHLRTLLEGAAADPDRRLGSLPLLTAAERRQLLGEWNATERLSPEPELLHEIFAAQAARTPRAEAVVCDGQSLSYAELDQASNRWARHLRAMGAGPEVLVGICLERSLDQVVALLAVLKAGGAYVPLDPEHPAERLAFVLEDTGTPLVLTQSALAGRLPENGSRVVWEEARDTVEQQSAAPLGVEMTPDHLVYVIYTSGSTGRPKGAMLTHRSVRNRLLWGLDQQLSPGRKRVLYKTPLGFDVSVWEIFAPLLHGSTLVVARPGAQGDSAYLGALIREQRVTHADFVPSLLQVFLDEPGVGEGSTLERITSAGEALAPELLERSFARLPKTAVLNAYGPTEASVAVTYWHGEPGCRELPIGRPMWNTRLYVVDRLGEPVPVGVSGEICIGGIAPGRGYWRRPHLTAERFVPDGQSAEPGSRVYRTGDLGRWRPDGMLEFLGRIDHQVKVRGFRIELGEIEAALLGHPGVRQTVVLARQEGSAGRRLVAYVVGTGEAPLEAAEMRSYLRERLPEYMVPSAFVKLGAMPLTANGKVDREALPAPERLDGELSYVAPRTPAEALMAGIWAEILGRDRIGAEDDFFEIGGHSLLAVQVVSRIREAFGVEVGVRRLFEASTLSALTASVQAMRREAEPAVPPLERVPRDGELRLSFAQERLWFLDQLDPGQPVYNMPNVVRLLGALSVGALVRSFHEIVRRHEVLRTSFGPDGGAPILKIASTLDLRVPEVDLEGLPGAMREREARCLGREDGRRPFDLANAPLLRTTLLRMGPEDHLLCVSLHHAVGDDWSMGLFLRELATLYEAFSAGELSPLPELPIQYADFAQWQRRWMRGEVLSRELAFWRQHLGGAPQLLELPTDWPRPAFQSYRGGNVAWQPPGGLKEKLHVLARRSRTTLFVALLAGLESQLFRYTGGLDLVLGFPVAGRNRIETEKLIGLFVNTLPLRTVLTGEETFSDLVEKIHRSLLETYAHQDLPFEKLVEELAPERSLGQNPLFQVMLVLQNAPWPELRLGDLRLVPQRVEPGTSKFDLTFLLDELSGLAGILEFNADLFEASTAGRMLGHFQLLLEEAAADPDRRIDALPLLTAAERLQLLEEWNAAERLSPEPDLLHEIFAAQAARAPQAEAVAFERQSLSYAEFDEASSRWAHHLRALGVEPEVLVGVCLERSLDQIVALLAILKAGGAYVPLDPEHPAERLAFVLEETGAPLVLTQSALAERLPENGSRIVIWEEARDAVARQSAAPPRVEMEPENLVYVIYTSGSTGRPKGAMLTHRGIRNRLLWGLDQQLGPGQKRVLYKTPLSFDVSVWEIFAPLLHGSTLVVARPGAQGDSAYLAELIREQRVTHADFVPSLLQVFLEELGVGEGSTLERITSAGEVLTPELLERSFARLPGTAVLNVYGPTEASLAVTYWHCEAGCREIPIGRPMWNARLYVVDRLWAPVPVGVPGEICIGGIAPGRGYWRRPDLTAERFVPDGQSGEPGSRVYRTGDLGHWRPDGKLEFLGRIDHQVKVRGFRIELGEIEAALLGHPGVRETMVLARQEGSAGGPRLVAYVVGTGELEASELRSYLRERLPEYMVPSAFVKLAAMPLTANGKVDRKALPAPESTDRERAYVAPRTPAEELMAGIWAEVLGHEQVGAEDDFFDVGGHSLLAVQVASRIRETFGVEVGVRRLFEYPTLSALTASVQAARREAEPAIPPLQRVQRDGALRLSFAQERLWFLDQLAPGQSVYNMPLAVRLRGNLSFAALKRALEEIVRRHEVLRTSFGSLDGLPVAHVASPRPFGLGLADLSGLPGLLDIASELRHLAFAESGRPFDLSRGPLLRAQLLRLGDGDHALLWNMHHIVSDGWSIGVVIEELSALYGAFSQGLPSPLPELPIQYADYAAWQRAWLAGDLLSRELSFWQEKLAGAPPSLELPTDHPRAAVRVFHGSLEPFSLPPELAQGLMRLTRSEGATLFMVLLGALGALLHRFTDQEDMVLGTPTAGRSRPQLEGLIGLFVNTLALRLDLSGEPSFRGLLARTRFLVLDAYAHEEVPFERVVEALGVARNLSHAPLFQVMLALQNVPVRTTSLPGLELSLLEVESGTAKFDLTFSVTEGEGGLSGAVEYSTDLFDRPTIRRLLGHWQRLLEGAAADPDHRLDSLPLLTPAERMQLVDEWNAAERLSPEPELLHEIFAAQASRASQAEAVVFEGQSLSYAELEEASNRWAHYLRAMGVGPEVLVGVCLERSLDQIVALLAILKAGGAYVPLDPEHPAERLAFVLEEIGRPPVLTQEELVDRLPGNGSWVVVWEEARDEVARQSVAPPAVEMEPDNLVYVIYTSGSTGRPKGAMLTHRGIRNRVLWGLDQQLGPGRKRVLYKTPLSFDVSVWEIFAPLLHGSTLVVARPGAQGDSAYLSSLIREQRVTHADFVPSLLQVFLEEPGVGGGSTLERITSAGEALTPELLERSFARLPGTAVLNVYGPTEASLAVTYWHCEPGCREVPIGRPMWNARLYVVDRLWAPVPVGVSGEICIGGIAPGRGYWCRPDLTAERFVPDGESAEPGSRVYRTGDLGRWRADGMLEFLGRIDHQVKVRGFRVELGEIESALLGHPGVRETVVLAREEGSAGRRLVAYVVGMGEEPVEPMETAELRSYLRERLPEYMVPSAFVQLSAMPLTANGKVDRKALPAPDSAEGERAYVAPRNPAEALIAEIWAEVLGREQVGAEDDFFAIGGHSLVAVQVVSRIREAFGVEIGVWRLFESSTLSALTAAVQAARGDLEPAPPSLERVPRDGELRLSFAQERLWFLDQLDPGQSVYNMPLAVRLRGSLSFAALERALDEIVRRHEVLRTSFGSLDGLPLARIEAPRPFVLGLADLSGLPGLLDMEPELRRLSLAESSRPFDLSRGPLFRALLLRLGDGDHALLWNMHHIVSDGWSIGVVIEELSALYSAFSQGLPSPLAELPIQYADYAAWQRAWLAGEVLAQELSFWQKELAGAAPLLELPTDRPRAALQTFRGALETFSLPPELAQGLMRLTRSDGATLFMVLLGALGTLLHRSTGQDDLVLGTPSAGRSRPQLERLIGLFVNTLALRLDLSGEPSFRELLARIRSRVLEAYAHEEVPFEKVVETLGVSRNLSYAPLFQVMLVLQNVPVRSTALPGLELSLLEADSGTAKFDLTFSITEGEERLSGAVEYNTDLFDRSTIRRLLGHWQRLLEGVAADPERRLDSLPLLTPAERLQLLEEWNAVEQFSPEPEMLHEIFAAQAARAPRAEAVVFEGQSLSYAELEEASNRWAHHLRALGVEPEVLVGVCLERSLDQTVALLAILKAGGAYVPLDPEHPAERLAFVLEQTGAPLVLTQRALADRLPENRSRVVVWEEALDTVSRRSAAPPRVEMTPDNLVYVIYTSGSTGRPKGAMLTHRGIRNRLLWGLDQQLGPGQKRVLYKTPLGFDVSVWEIFAPLLHGSTLVVARPGAQGDSAYLASLIREQRVTHADFVPSLLQVFLEEPEVGEGSTLERITSAGEALTPELLDRSFAHLPETAVLNVYGPTEASLAVTYWHCEPGCHEVPIGRPMWNARLYVVDRLWSPVPVGVSGEICIGGIAPGRGYWRRPDLTAERFVPDGQSAEPGARVYRTGDLGRWRPDGMLEFLGRIDHQVKVRGFRIELGEIESALLGHPGVRETVVLARQEGSAGSPRLVAYLVGTGEEPVEPMETAELQSYLRERLPEYMVPSAFVRLGAMPLTANGKMDRKALPAPESADRERAYVAPRTPVEERVAAIWGELLENDRIGIEDDFFELGGHSLLATQVVARVRKAFHLEDLPLNSLFRQPTVAAMALLITQIQAEHSDDEEALLQMIEELQGHSPEDLERLLRQEDLLLGDMEAR